MAVTLALGFAFGGELHNSRRCSALGLIPRAAASSPPFSHISLARSSRDDLQLVLFSTLIVALMVSGTIVILTNLHERMM